MSWSTTTAVVLLTSAAGAGAAAILANFLVDQLQIPAREGAAGYFSVFVIATGLVCGFIVGLATALTMQSGFWKVQGYALAITAVLTVLAGIITVALDDHGPKLDGDQLVLEVELKCPPNWQPDAASKEKSNFCWLQRDPVDADLRANPIVSGTDTMKTSADTSGQYLVSCGVPLTTTRKNRYMRVFVGDSLDITIQVPLPRKPGAPYKQWSQWTDNTFLPQPGKPPAPGYSYRFRVRGATL